jgi:hypothetical protein
MSESESRSESMGEVMSSDTTPTYYGKPVTGCKNCMEIIPNWIRTCDGCRHHENIVDTVLPNFGVQFYPNSTPRSCEHCKELQKLAGSIECPEKCLFHKIK